LKNNPSAGISKQFQIPIPASTEMHTVFLKEDGTLASNADANADPTQNPRYRATLVFTVPPATSKCFGTLVRVLITWPALADKTGNAAPVNFAGSYETLTALDRS